MRKLVALIIVALMLVSIPVSLALQFPRQVDPATAPTDPVYGQGLYLFYGSVVVALTGGNYSAARALLGETPFIHIPPEILDAVNSFDSLVNNTANQFRVINYQLANASNFLATGRVSLARANLTAAVSNLRDVNQTLTQLLAAEPQLAALTGIPSSLLLQKLQPLETIYNGDVAQADRLLKVLTGLSKLEPTSITLSVVQVSIIVGSNVTVSGLLRGPTGSPLDSRNVSVFFQGRLIGKATTDSAGRYSAQLRTPFFYQKNATMFASFLPAGGDSLVYAPATSPLVNVTVTFVTPSISFTAPNSVNAGQPLTVNGTLTLGGRPLGGYQVSLSGFKTTTFGATPTSTGLTGPDGTFSVSLTPSSSLGRGTYPVTLGTSSNGTVGPLLVSIPIDVNKETPVVDSTIPGFALAGFPVTISGSVKANGSGIAGAQVLNTSPSPSVDTATSRSGGFSFTVTPSLTTANGAWTYTVEVYPSQSWISAVPVNVSIFVVNPLVLIFPLSSLGLLGLVVRRRRSPAQMAAQELAPATEPASSVQRPRPTEGMPGIYFQAVALVEKATSLPSLPQMTVREYLAAVKGVLKGIEHFRSVSYEHETHLYAGGVAAADEAKARAELDSLRRELES